MMHTLRRPLALVLTGSLCAFFLCLFLPGRFFLPVTGILLLPALYAALSKRAARKAFILLLLSGFLFGILWRVGYDHLFMLPGRSLAGCRESVSAIVTEERGYGYVVHVRHDGRRFKAFCRYYGDGSIAPGDKLTFAASFSLPARSGSFDADRFYSAQGIPVSCVIDADTLSVEKNASPLHASYYRLRQGTLRHISRLFGRYDGEMAALLIGEKTALPERTRTQLAASGLSHTFVVSGMHLSFLVSMLSFLRGRRIYLWIVLPVSLFFAVFSGLGVSILRALLMLVYTTTADALSLPRDPITELVASLFPILLFNPYAFLNAGLVLSYLAVAGVFFLAPPVCSFLSSPFRHVNGLPRRLLSSFVRVFSVSLSAGLATLPAAALYMRHVSVIFLISNLLLLWLVEAVFVLGAAALLAGLLWVPFGKLLAIPVTWLLSRFLSINAAFAAFPYADVGVESPFLLIAIAFAVGTLFVLAVRKKPLFKPLPLAFVVLPLLTALLVTEIDASNRSFTLTALPSDRECALLSSHGVHFLIGWDEEAADLLLRRNIDYIDYLILPENGQADRFLLTFPVGEVLEGESAVFRIGDTEITLFSEGNLIVSAGGRTVSVLLVPGVIRSSDALLLSREALKSPHTASLLNGTPVYAFGKPPKNPRTDISLLRSAYASGELTFVAAGGTLKIR